MENTLSSLANLIKSLLQKLKKLSEGKLSSSKIIPFSSMEKNQSKLEKVAF